MTKEQRDKIIRDIFFANPHFMMWVQAEVEAIARGLIPKVRSH